MAGGTSTGLARVTVASPRRRVDIALPENVVVAELLPAILRSAGDGLADDGQRQGGWILRRTDGQAVDARRSLGVQDIRDGEILHLVERRAEWPELDYDDVVDAIATGARKQSRSWGSAATRRAGISVAAVGLALALGLLLSTGPTWFAPGAVALGAAVVLVATATALSRAMGDAGAGTAIGVVAMVYAFVGGSLLLAEDLGLTELGAPHYLVGSGALFVISLIAYAGVANRTQYFVAGMVIGFLGVIGSLLGRASHIDTFDVGAILISVVVAFTPAMPLLAIRIGKLPMPTLPSTAEELLADPPQVPAARVHATVKRSDELLTGMLLGASIVAGGSLLVLTLSGRLSAIILVAIVSVATLLRARLFPALRHRVPLLASGFVGAAALGLALQSSDADLRLLVGVPVLIVVAGIALACGLYFQNRAPSPYAGRIADILDVLLVVAVVPVACIVVGLYTYLRGLFG